MKNKQKGFVIPIVIAIVALLVLGGGYVFYSYQKGCFGCNKGEPTKSLGDIINNIPISTTTNKTSDWKVYTNTQYGFEVKYPSDWKITDKSMTDSTINTKYPSVNIESPLRYDLPGYINIATSYRILIYRPEAEIISIADFGSNEKPAQSWWNTNVTKATKEATDEYKVGQQIISSFKFISAEQILSNKLIINSISGPKNLDVGQNGTWKINTSAPVGTDISYAVDYGDNTIPTFGALGNNMISPNPSFTHSYDKAGTYTLTFSATEQKKGVDTIKTTVSVVVGSINQAWIKILSPKEGENITKGQAFNVTWEVSPDLGDQLINVYTETEIGYCKIGSASGFKGIAQITLQDAPGCFIPLGQHQIQLEAVSRSTGKIILTNGSGYYFNVK